MFPPRRAYIVPLAGNRQLCLGERPLLMGVLNVTPDSFADHRAFLDPAAAIERALQMVEEGADIVDIGGESTRPGTEPVGLHEERSRVLPVVKGLAKQIRVPISVDTYKAELARDALAEGAAIINDISGLRYEPGLADVVAAGSAARVLNHKGGRTTTK
jgi:dihydropteroate synthase